MIFDLKTESSLVQALFVGNVDQVESLIKNNVDVNYQSINGRVTALHAAVHCCEDSSKLRRRISNEEASDNVSHEFHDRTEIKKKHIEIVRLLCNAGARVNCKDSKNLTPLHYACRSNSEEAVGILLEHSAVVNSRDINWQSPLHICAIYNSVNCAKLLLDKLKENTTSIDLSDRQGRSALAQAAFNGNLEMVQLLLENGADCNIRDKQERRPLHWASYVGYTDIIKVLVDFGADVNCLDKDLYTPLLVACASGKSEETIQLLISMGADYNATLLSELSIFHLACLNGHDIILKQLLNMKVGDEKLQMKCTSKGVHPIHFAAASKTGSLCLDILVALGVDVNMATYGEGTTPMHIAAMNNRTSCALILFSNGASVNTQDNSNNTPLHLATQTGSTAMIRFLVESGANIYIRGNNGMSPWAMAALNGHYECFRILDQIIPTISARKQFFEMQDDYDRTFIHLAAISGNYECLNLFLKTDCNPNQVDVNGNTPLHYACMGSYLKCVELLIHYGADVNEVNDTLVSKLDLPTSYFNPRGSTPLMLACAFDQDGYVVRELILNAHARADLVDSNGYNTLHYAAFQGNINVLEILLCQCKQLNQHSNDNQLSPLHILAYYGHREALEFLIKFLPDIKVTDKKGRTALDMACIQGQSSCVECLMFNGASCETRDSVTGRTPVHSAAMNNHEECLKIIILIFNSRTDCRNNRTYESNDCYSTYDDSMKNSFFNNKLANLKDDQGRTPLMLATEQGHLNTISFLVIQMGANVLAFDEKGRTALHRAAALGYEECCAVILKSDPSSVMQRDNNGLLPLHYAIMAGHANLIIMFFEHYENYLEILSNQSTNTVATDDEKPQDLLLDYKGFSLLHYSCFYGHATCTETICELSDSYPFLVDMLINSNEQELLASFTKLSPMHCACLNGQEVCLGLLLDKFEDRQNLLTELEDENGNRPLHMCAMSNEYGCTTVLLEANCRLGPRNRLGQTPFMLAAGCNSFGIMELLWSDERSLTDELSVEDKIDLNSKDFKGNTALHLALLNEHENCALFILDKLELNSELVNYQNVQGQTPLHLAATKGFLTCVEILLSKGADIWLKNKRQHTPLISCAKNSQVADCLELMLSRLMLMNANPQSGNRANTTSNLMMMMMSGQKKTPPTSQKNRLRLNQANNSHNSSHINADTFTTSDSNNNLNSTELKLTSNHTHLESNSENFNQINEQQNLNSTLIMNENVTSSGSSDENLNTIVPEEVDESKEFVQKEETINKENLFPVVNSKMTKNEIALNSSATKTINKTAINEIDLNLDKIKPRSLSNNSNSSSDSDFY